MVNSLRYFIPFIICMLGWLYVYSQSLDSMVNIWLNSETYKHCFLILPVVLYLIYEKREQLQRIEIKPAYWVLIPLILGQIAFLFSDLVDVKLLVQLSAYGSLVCLIWANLGTKIVTALMFPLFYLVLAVPMGEELVPLLQDITADISVLLVQFTGIPVYREGLYIYIPNGTFEVAEACAGIRFLIATVAMGFLYAYLFYRSFWYRIVFVLFCILVPIIANGIRAYGIIAIGYYSDMKHAVGADHLVYGWFFFAFILLLIMGVGRIWREDLQPESNCCSVSAVKPNYQKNHIVAIAVFMALMIKPAYEQFILQNGTEVANKSSVIIAKAQQVFEPIDTVSWFPKFQKSSESFSGKLLGNELYIGYYAFDRPESELIAWNNQVYDIEAWSKVSEQPVTIKLSNRTITATKLELIDKTGKQLSIVYWYQTENEYSSKKLSIKFSQLVDKLAGGAGAGYIVGLRLTDSKSDIQAYQRFLTQNAWLLGEAGE